MSEPTYLGTIEIPTSYNQQISNTAQQARAILDKAETTEGGKAAVFEFKDKREAQLHRSMLYTMAILRYGEAGRIGTRLLDNLLYVWRTHAEYAPASTLAQAEVTV